MNCIEFLDSIVFHLTGEKPVIEVHEDQYGAVISIKVNGNVSSLIGKQGATINAIRVLVKAIGYNSKHRLMIRINENT